MYHVPEPRVNGIPAPVGLPGFPEHGLGCGCPITPPKTVSQTSHTAAHSITGSPAWEDSADYDAWHAVDWTLAGDDEPIPMAQRPSIIAVQQEPTLTGKCALYARHTRLVAARITPTLQMLRASADADARAIYQPGETQRRTGGALFIANLRRAGQLRAGLNEQQAADAIWALSPDIL